MNTAPHSARITGPITYAAAGGTTLTIPLGPCLVEQFGTRTVDIVWGSEGEHSVGLSVEEALSATELGHLLLLD